MLVVGSRFEEAAKRYRDPQTAARITRLTSDPSINHLLGFLTSSFRPGNPGELAFVTHRVGDPQLCLLDLDTGIATVLTATPDLLPFSPAFTPDGAWLTYTTRLGEIRRVSCEDPSIDERLASLDGAGLGELSPSPDGRYLATACRRGETHGVCIVDIRAGSCHVIVESTTKIVHPQFHPDDPSLIVYARDPAPRIWSIRRDGSANTNLLPNTEAQFYVHETFLPGTEDMLFVVWPYRLCRFNLHERQPQLLLEKNVWHLAARRDGRLLVADTNHPDNGLILIHPGTGESRSLCYPNASGQGTQWCFDYPADAETWATRSGIYRKSLSWFEMPTDTIYGPQWTHPHPTFDESGNRVVFQSDVTGHPQLYLVDVEPRHLPDGVPGPAPKVR